MSVQGKNNPFFGKSHTFKSKTKISMANSTGIVYIYNNIFQLVLVINSITQFSKLINSNVSTIRNSILKQKIFRGQWYFISEIIQFQETNNFIYNEKLESHKAIVNEIRNCKIRKAVFVFSSDRKEFFRSYTGVVKAAQDLHISHNSITKQIKVNGKIGKYIFSEHRILKIK